MKQLSNKTRLCGVCERMVEADLIDTTWTPDHGVVQRFRSTHKGRTHEWDESRLPLDDPRNVSPFAVDEKIKAKRK